MGEGRPAQKESLNVRGARRKAARRPIGVVTPKGIPAQETISCSITTCSYRDWIGADFLVCIGVNPANSQPVILKYLY